MTFLVIFAVLVAERFLLRFQSLRRGGWYQHWMDLHQSLPVSKVLREGRIGLLLLLAPPLLGVALVIGLVVSILQAVTQVNELTLTFVPKMLGVMLLLLVMLPYLARKMMTFTVEVFEMIGS